MERKRYNDRLDLIDDGAGNEFWYDKKTKRTYEVDTSFIGAVFHGTMGREVTTWIEDDDEDDE